MSRLLVFGAAFCGLASLAQANLVINGDFETSVPSYGPGGGWTSATIDGLGGWRSTGGNLGGYFILNSNGSSSDPIVRQTVTGLIAGRTYLLSGDYVSIYGNSHPPDDTDSFLAMAGGAVVYQGGPTAFNNWQHFEVGFVATDSNMIIGFAGEANGSDNDFGVDNIVLEVPSAGTLGLIGLGGLTIFRRRR